MDGASESRLPTRPWDLLNARVGYPREMRYLWKLLGARRRELKVGCNSVEDCTGDFAPSLRGRCLDRSDELDFCVTEHSVNVSITFRLFIPFSP